MAWYDYINPFPHLKNAGRAIAGLADESQSSKDKRDDLNRQGQAAGDFANQGQAGFTQLGSESAAARQHLADQASGKVSLSAEQLRQGLGQQVAQQRSLAAGAAPQNAAMAARQSAMNTARLGYGMSGAAATAGIQERSEAANSLNQALAQQRAMELQAALGSRTNAVNAYGNTTPDKSLLDKWGNAVIGGVGAAIK